MSQDNNNGVPNLIVIIILIILAISIFGGCTSPSNNSRKVIIKEKRTFVLYMEDKKIKCDSFQMISTDTVYIWVNGVKMKVISKNPITVEGI